MEKILTQLFESKTLSKEDAKNILLDITSGQYNSSQVAAFMSVFLMRTVTVDELIGFREAMLERCLKIDFNGYDTLDIVGTGGDGKDTFNISTLACFITAGAGIKITKHGNYGVSSVSGSSNVLEAIGYKFANDVSQLEKQLDQAGICFMHAPLFHPAMKTVAPIRKELGVRTFFNLLGPIVNPSSPKYSVIGIYNLEMARLYNYLLQNVDSQYVLLHSFDGYDEISLTSEFKLISKNKEQVIKPSDLGIEPIQQQAIYGGKSIKEAAYLFLNILNGKGNKAQNDVVCINAAAAIHCAQPETSLSDCFLIAKESLEASKALKVYQQLISN